jgi:triosephosphate isomerase
MDGLVVLNFKTYVESTGKRALALAKVCEEVAGESGAKIIVCPQAADLRLIASEVSIPVYAQHMDNIKPGSSTGWTLPEAVLEAGARGCLVNHSEHRLTVADVDAVVSKLRELKMASIVCTNNVLVSQACAALSPDYVAVEPPELIGGDISVSTAQPGIISGSVAAVRKVNPKVGVLCGAGVKNGVDVAKSIELGSGGVLLASGVVKAKEPKKVLLDLVSGLK